MLFFGRVDQQHIAVSRMITIVKMPYLWVGYGIFRFMWAVGVALHSADKMRYMA